MLQCTFLWMSRLSPLNSREVMLGVSFRHLLPLPHFFHVIVVHISSPSFFQSFLFYAFPFLSVDPLVSDVMHIVSYLRFWLASFFPDRSVCLLIHLMFVFDLQATRLECMGKRKSGGMAGDSGSSLPCNKSHPRLDLINRSTISSSQRAARQHRL